MFYFQYSERRHVMEAI